MNDEGALARRPRQRHEPLREYQSAATELRPRATGIAVDSIQLELDHARAELSADAFRRLLAELVELLHAEQAKTKRSSRPVSW